MKMPEWWWPGWLRGQDIYVGLRDRGPAPDEHGGRVPIRYQAHRGAKVYRAARARVEIDSSAAPVRLQPGAWVDPPPEESSTRTDVEPEVERLRRELADAHRRIAELEGMLRRRPRVVSTPAEFPVDLNDLIGLCHPDRHPAARHDVANRVTAQLLALRGRR